jgi:RNA 2',3'-cyclic 3'-phosphodiesterase
MKRIFIALKVQPEESRLEMISAFRSGLEHDVIKWTNPENIHVTLAFLGDTDEETIKDISSMLHNSCKGSGQFDLIIRGCGVFRNMDDPRIIWTGIEPSENLTYLNGLIMNGLKGLNIKMENRPFNPHLTIGRIKHLSEKESLRSLLNKFQKTVIQIVHVNEVILYESILLQSGPVYKAIDKINLM